MLLNDKMPSLVPPALSASFDEWWSHARLEGKSLFLNSGCKINLFLRITGLLPNGYHSLDTFFIPLAEPHDVLELRLQQANILDCKQETALSHKRLLEQQSCGISELRFSSSDQSIDNTDNTLVKLFRLYKDYRLSLAQQLECPVESPVEPPVEFPVESSVESPVEFSVERMDAILSLHLQKGVPHGAGLGGASANAAVLLHFLELVAIKNKLAPLSEPELLALALKVGADVPIFLYNKAARATGVGEKLEFKANPLVGHFLVLVWPGHKISTVWAYQEYDRWLLLKEQEKNKSNIFECLKAEDKKNKEKTKKCLTEINSLGTHLFSQGMNLQNDFEAAVSAHCSDISLLKEIFLQHGASIALMSGSGSAVFGVFELEELAQKAYHSISSNYSAVYLQRL